MNSVAQLRLVSRPSHADTGSSGNFHKLSFIYHEISWFSVFISWVIVRQQWYAWGPDAICSVFFQIVLGIYITESNQINLTILQNPLLQCWLLRDEQERDVQTWDSLTPSYERNTSDCAPCIFVTYLRFLEMWLDLLCLRAFITWCRLTGSIISSVFAISKTSEQITNFKLLLKLW